MSKENDNNITEKMRQYTRPTVTAVQLRTGRKHMNFQYAADSMGAATCTVHAHDQGQGSCDTPPT